MKYINLKINSCDQPCPYMDVGFHNEAEGWCCKSENEIDDVTVIPDFCELDAYENERECRCGGGCGK